MSLGANQTKYGQVNAAEFIIHYCNHCIKIMIQTCIQHIMKKKLVAAKKHVETLTLKRLGEGVNLSQPPPPLWFFEIVSSKQRVKSYFFVTFKIIMKHIFSENFIEIPQVVQKIWRIFLSILAIFINFYHFFGFFDISLLQRN